MLEERDYVLISVPFAAGVAFTAASEPSGTILYLIASISQIAAAALFVTALSGRRRPAIYSALYLALGIFTCCCALVQASPGRQDMALHIRAVSGAEAVIDRCNYASPQTAGLLKALLTGDRQHLNSTTIAEFRKAGASHMLALSGLHLGIIYAMLSWMLSALGNTRAAKVARSLLSIGLCLFYVLATGAPDSIVRAFIFICLNELSRHSPGRRRDPFALLCAALTIHLAIKPLAITQTGFQLSYLAMTGICILYPQIREWYPVQSRWSISSRIWNGAALAISCQAATAPLVWFRFHTFPTRFLLTNLMVMPLSEAFIISGVAGTALEAAGAGWDPIKNLTDCIGQAILFCIKVIASIS